MVCLAEDRREYLRDTGDILKNWHFDFAHSSICIRLEEKRERDGLVIPVRTKCSDKTDLEVRQAVSTALCHRSIFARGNLRRRERNGQWLAETRSFRVDLKAIKTGKSFGEHAAPAIAIRPAPPHLRGLLICFFLSIMLFI